MNPALAGAIAGMLHVFAGPDHLVAVAPLALRRPALAFRVGTLWGLGHASGVLLLGGIGVVARSFINIGSVSAWAEFLVGAVLVSVGLWAILQSRHVLVHRHRHEHPEVVPSASDAATLHEHLHAHVVAGRASSQEHTKHHEQQTKTSFMVGMVHGAAGTGHLLGVIPSLALPPLQGAQYLLAYGIAAVFSMGAFGAIMGALGHHLSPARLRVAMLAAGGVAICLGGYWMVRGWPW